ncbi:PorV/PorQ family protein [Perlabentimonas gracilis]|uniref:hypothetical protein n=1 Tax=Perlabentimonas gracilis TaxID=2715279 RepID=UPI00140BEB2C|nr:hypothetical protein [Perlabentimonas gracilis]NHB68382.1 hypothetical protein [Perlabentimonas gracilis]
MIKEKITHNKPRSRVPAILAMASLILMVSPYLASADLPEEKAGARSAGLGYSTAAIIDGWSLFHNQAGVAYLENPWVGVHHENRFISPDLNFSALGAMLPVRVGTLGLSIKRLGFSQFSQTKLGLAYGMKLAPTLSAGVQLNAHHIFVAGEYGSTMVLSAEGGLIYSPNDNLNVGFHVVNPTRSKLLDDQRIPTLLNLGLSYQIGDMVMVTSGVEKNLDADFSFKAGVEFEPINSLYFRMGMASNPSLLTFGVGYQISSIQIDLAFSRHEILGYTPHFSLSYVFGAKASRLPETETPQQ